MLSGKRLCAANHDIHLLNIHNYITCIIILVGPELLGVGIGVSRIGDASSTIDATINFLE